MSAILMSNQSFRVSVSAASHSPSAGSHEIDEPELFSREELQQFADEDRDAGRRIGTILSALFIYPLVVMTVVIWWTLRTVGH